MSDWKAVPSEPTQEMLIAARDWSAEKYGKPVGDDGAKGCYAAMLAAAPTRKDAPQIEEWREMLINPQPWADESERIAAINALCDMALQSLDLPAAQAPAQSKDQREATTGEGSNALIDNVAMPAEPPQDSHPTPPAHSEGERLLEAWIWSWQKADPMMIRKDALACIDKIVADFALRAGRKA